jgi:acyl-CoA reductase-like NAD-dependent aldehyde dehydrogenase
LHLLSLSKPLLFLLLSYLTISILLLYRNPKADSVLMSDEIFGPVLPIIAVDSIPQAIATV